MRREKITDYIKHSLYECMGEYDSKYTAIRAYIWERMYENDPLNPYIMADESITAYDKHYHYPFWRIKKTRNEYLIEKLNDEAMQKVIKVYQILESL